MINVTIDEKTIQVPEGTTVLRAAEMAGVYIPTLCDHSHLTPYGGCRLCLVEVEGARVLQPSCTLPVNPNMVVHTDTPKVHDARKFVLTLIFSERNHFCPYCQVSGGDCELQNAAYKEDMTHWPLQPNWERYAVDASHPNFILEHNRCILCRRCVRACSELVGNFTLGFEERGAKSFLVADLGIPLGKSSCVSCGTCVQVCPTGALIDRVSAYRGKEIDVQNNQSICVGCSVGCGINVVSKDNRMIRVEGNWDAPVNNGVLCVKGRFESTQDDDRQRIITPMVRKDGSLKAATWQEAFNVITSKIKPLAGKKNNGIAALVSTRLSAESMALFRQLFLQHLGSDMVTSTEEGYSTSASAKLSTELGNPFEGNLEAVKNADCVMAIGVNLVENHQVVGFFVKRALPNGTTLIVADPEKNPLDEAAECTLKFSKGSDVDLFKGLSAAVVKLGLAKIKSTIQHDTVLKEAAQKTGLSTDTFLKTATLMATANSPAIIYGKGITGTGSVDALKALLDFASLVGALSDTNSSVVSVKGEANSMAASLLQLDTPFKLNGHQATYVALGDYLPSERLVQTLEKAPFKIVQASYESKLTATADVVLPVAIWAEEDGHYINLEGRVQKSVKSIEPPQDVLTNVDVLNQLATLLDIKPEDNWKKQISQQVPSVTIKD